MTQQVPQLVDHLFRREAGRMSAALVGIFGLEHLDLVEDVVQDALMAALERWPFDGIPDNPRAWLVRVARNRALDALKHKRQASEKFEAICEWAERQRARSADATPDDSALEDELRLMVACCDSRLSRDAQIALTLKVLCGFGIKEIASAFLSTPETIAQRIVRAKKRIREEGIQLDVPGEPELTDRLGSLLEVLYLMFNEGYRAHSGNTLIRRDLMEEAARLTTLMLRWEVTSRPQVHALLALMLFHLARADQRLGPDGVPLLLDEQDRSAWDQGLIQRGFHHLDRAHEGGEMTPLHLEAGIAGSHARTASFQATDWDEILTMYDLLVRIKPTPVVRLNRAAAIACGRGLDAGLTELESLREDPALARYPLLPETEGELLVRAGRWADGAERLEAALALETSEPVKARIQARLDLCHRNTSDSEAQPNI